MFQFLLILTVAYFFFRWADKNKLPPSDKEARILHKDAKKEKPKKYDDDEGDYIDYEEIKD